MGVTCSVFFISDHTGITVEALGHSLLAQFPNTIFETRVLPFVDSPEKAAQVVQQINTAASDGGSRPLVFVTLADPSVREMVAAADALCFDFMTGWLDQLEQALGQPARPASGRTHGVVDTQTYNLRMDAVNFALVTDDGAATRSYARADIILVGLSRSGKTPTCLYLAMQHSLLVANYPLTEEDLGELRLPTILELNRKRLYALTIEPARLHEIRSRRRPDSRYASLKQCQYEVRQVEALYRHQGISPLDTSQLSVEEIASTILRDTGLKWHDR